MNYDDDNLDTELDAELQDRGDDVGDLPPEDDDLPEDEAGEEEQAEEEAEPEEEPAPAKGSKSVPHARFNEVNEALKQERAARLQLEEELARARGAQQPEPKPAAEPAPTPDADIKALRKQLREAIYEGDDNKAEALEDQIDSLSAQRQARIAEQRATELLEQQQKAQQQKAAQSEMQAVVTEAYQSYPFLDVEGAEPNQDAIDEVVALRDLYLSRGQSAAQAIAAAVAKVGPRYADEPAVKPARAPKTGSVAQNLEREKRIPPSMPGVGERARKIDYSALTEEEFDNLSAVERKKARGDFVG